MTDKELIDLFCSMYKQETEETKTPEQVLLLKYFKEAEDELPVCASPAWFFQAWRKIDIIYSRGMASKDMIVWNLIALDDAVQRVVKKFPWPKSAE